MFSLKLIIQFPNMEIKSRNIIKTEFKILTPILVMKFASKIASIWVPHLKIWTKQPNPRFKAYAQSFPLLRTQELLLWHELRFCDSTSQSTPRTCGSPSASAQPHARSQTRVCAPSRFCAQDHRFCGATDTPQFSLLRFSLPSSPSLLQPIVCICVYSSADKKC